MKVHGLGRSRCLPSAGVAFRLALGVIAALVETAHVGAQIGPVPANPAAHSVIAGRDLSHVRVLFGGDTNYGESYQDHSAKRGGANILSENGYDYCIANLSRLLDSVDYRVLNLETPLTLHHEGALKGKAYLHYSDPIKLPEIFGRYGPTAYSLANNHTLDQGVPGLEDTFSALAAAKSKWFGAGENLVEASKPLLQKFQIGKSSVTLAVFGAFEYRRSYDEKFHFYASADHPGTATVDAQAAREAIAKLHNEVPDAFIVYFVHCGENYRWKTAEQEVTVHALKEAGADLVVCSGAHMMQEIEYDGRGWIFYGIGNFLFNAPGRYAANDAAPYSLPLVVDFSMKDGRLQTSLRVYPIVSDNMITNYQPRLVTETELSSVDALLAEKSSWDTQTRAAVKRGSDHTGPFLEFITPQTRSAERKPAE